MRKINNDEYCKIWLDSYAKLYTADWVAPMPHVFFSYVCLPGGRSSRNTCDVADIDYNTLWGLYRNSVSYSYRMWLPRENITVLK